MDELYDSFNSVADLRAFQKRMVEIEKHRKTWKNIEKRKNIEIF